MSEHWPEALACWRASSSSASKHSCRGRSLLLRVLPAATLGLLLALAVLFVHQRHQDAEDTSWPKLASCSALGLERVSCGPSGASEAQCRATGCCYDGNAFDGAVRCFQADSFGRGAVMNANAEAATFTLRKLAGLTAEPHWKQPVCTFQEEERVDCGWDGVLEWQCLKAGCCYGQPKGPDLPFCYHGKDTTSTTTITTKSVSTSPLFVIPLVPPRTTTTTITAMATTTRIAGPGFKEDDDGLTILNASGAAGSGGWGFRIVPLIISAVAACLVGSMVTVLLVGYGRSRGYEANIGVYSDGMRSPDHQGARVITGVHARNESITGGSYRGLNPQSEPYRYEPLQNSPDSARGSWAPNQVQNPI